MNRAYRFALVPRARVANDRLATAICRRFILGVVVVRITTNTDSPMPEARRGRNGA